MINEGLMWTGGIVAYVMIGIFVAVLLGCEKNDDLALLWIFGLFWPIVVAILMLFGVIIMLPYKAATWVRNKSKWLRKWF